jgi:hypothetical protein
MFLCDVLNRNIWSSTKSDSKGRRALTPYGMATRLPAPSLSSSAEPKMLATLEARLFGSANRIHWRAADIERIARRFGVNPKDIALPPLGNDPLALAAPFTTRAPAGTRGKSDKSYEFVISSAVVDRMGDTINLNGWQLGNFFKTGGPVLFGHDAQSPPIGRAIHIWSTGTRLKAVMQFASTPEAMTGTRRDQFHALNVRRHEADQVRVQPRPTTEVWHRLHRAGIDRVQHREHACQ